MTVIAYTLNVSRDIGARVTKETLLSPVRSAFQGPNASQRFTLQCADAETRLRELLGFSRVLLVVTMSVERRDNGALNAEDFVMLDSIAFGAMKAATGQGWSVLEIRRRLAPVGDSEQGSLSNLTRDPSGASRTVRTGNDCSPTVVSGSRVANDRVLNGSNPGQPRNAPPLIPPRSTDLPIEAKVAIGVGSVVVLSVAAAYVWRAFK